MNGKQSLDVRRAVIALQVVEKNLFRPTLGR